MKKNEIFLKTLKKLLLFNDILYKCNNIDNVKLLIKHVIFILCNCM